MIGFDGGVSKLILRSRNNFLFEWKGFMVRKDRRNDFFFEKEDKTEGYTSELGSEMIQQPFPSNGARNACWYFLTHTEIIRKRTELPL
jgi:hypothetical protein